MHGKMPGGQSTGQELGEKTLWLRSETKPGEQRTPLTPEDAKKLIKEGIKVFVESSQTRIFSDDQYQKAGCLLVPGHSWSAAPKSTYILGLKELPDSDLPLEHRHIYFAHAYKSQKGSIELLFRFLRGGGTLFDLEYLVDQSGRRIAAFGYWAGYVGAAVGLAAWYEQQAKKSLGKLAPFSDKSELINFVKANLTHQKRPKILIIGAKGRCGQGAAEFFENFDIELTLWDIEETRKGGPFSEILNFDILINCVLLREPVPPFVTLDLLRQKRELTVISDVSCDATNPHNPIRIYNEITTFGRPVHRYEFGSGTELHLIGIDHLPSLLPKESSEDFSSLLTPHLLELCKASDSLPFVWNASFETFTKHINPFRQQVLRPPAFPEVRL